MTTERPESSGEVSEERTYVASQNAVSINDFNDLARDFGDFLQEQIDALEQRLEELHEEKDPWKALREKDRQIKTLLKIIQSEGKKFRKKPIPGLPGSAGYFGEIRSLLAKIEMILKAIAAKLEEMQPMLPGYESGYEPKGSRKK